MPTFQERLEELTDLGLTRYEARAYLGLLELGEAKASEVGRTSKVPRGRVYEILQALHEKGLVELLPGTPRRFRPVSLHGFLRKKERHLRARADEIDRKLDELASQFPVGPGRRREEVGQFLVFRRRRPIMAKMREMIEGASGETLVVCSEACAIRGAKVHLRAYQEQAAAGVRQRMVCNVTERNAEAIEALGSALAIRHQGPGNRVATFMVVDGRQAIVSHWSPDDDDPFQGNDVAIWSDDEGMARALQEIGERAWEEGPDADTRLWEVRKAVSSDGTEILIEGEPLRRALDIAVALARDEIWSSTFNSLVNAEYKTFMDILEPLSERSVRRRVHIGYDGGPLRGAQAKADRGWEVRVSESVSLGRYLGIDRTMVVLFVTSPTSEEGVVPREEGVRGGNEFLLRTRDRRAVEVFREAYERAWERAVPLEEFTPERDGRKLRSVG